MNTTEYGGWWTALVVLLLCVAALVLYFWRRSRAERIRPARDPYTEGLSLMLAGRLSDAAGALTRAASDNTANIDAYLKLGTVYRQLGKPRRAAQIHLELTARSNLSGQTKAEVYRELARDMEQIGGLERAFRYLERARELDPSSEEDLEIKLRLLERQGRWREAGETLKKLSALKGEQKREKLALYKIQEGEASSRQGREHDARVCFKEALKLDPGAVEAMLFVAESYTREERDDDAIDWVSRFISRHPGRAQLAVPMLERLLFEAGRFDELETTLKEATAKAPDNRDLAATLIDILVKKGELEEALDLCNRLLDSDPRDLDVRVYRLRILKQKGDERGVDRGLEELLSLVAPYSRGYSCANCGFRSDRLLSRCPTCGQWRSFWGAVVEVKSQS